MSVSIISRRDVLGAGAALAGAATMPRLSFAQSGGSLVAITYPGAFEEAFAKVVVPEVRRTHNFAVTLTPMLVLDMVAKVTAARANPPVDVAMFDEGPLLANLANDLVEKFPAEKSQNFKDYPDPFRGFGDTGPIYTLQIAGIAYNPKRMAAPKSWNDMWKPEFKGRVGLTGMQSSLGTSFMCELARLHGGGEKNFEPAFAKIKELLPNVGALAPSPGALAALFQQGEVWIAPNYYGSVMLLKERGVDVDFALPESGAVIIRTTIHVVKNTKVPDLAIKYIDVLLSPKVQTALMEPPYYFVSSSSAVPFPAKTRELLGANVGELMKKAKILDWAEINKTRPQLIERFNREVKI